MPLSLRALGLVLNPLSMILPVPRLFRLGEQIAYLQLFDPICHGPKGMKLLKDLIQQLRRVAYADGITILTLFVYADDPIAGLPRFFPQEVLHYNTMMKPLCKANLPERPFYLDIRDI